MAQVTLATWTFWCQLEPAGSLLPLVMTAPLVYGPNCWAPLHFLMCAHWCEYTPARFPSPWGCGPWALRSHRLACVHFHGVGPSGVTSLRPGSYGLGAPGCLLRCSNCWIPHLFSSMGPLF